MRKLVMAGIFLAAILLTPCASIAQIKLPLETRNAALRYWMAFADLQDPPADKATQDLLEKTAAGESAWNEAKLGPILDRNMQAIQEMQRATKLPECDWGLEYSRGARASVAQLTRARVLARLNTLYGMRMMAKGQTQGAIESWLDGVRFSRHLAQGGTLIFKLVARVALLSDFRALTSAGEGGHLQTTQKTEIATAIRSLPAYVLNWSEALGLEEAVFESAVQEMRQSKYPAAVYEDLNGEPPPANFSLPPEKDVVGFRSVIVQAQLALRLPPGEARERLGHIQKQVAQFGDFFQRAVPSLVKINDVRADVEASRARLLLALAKS
jgi:hypothetical protein